MTLLIPSMDQITHVKYLYTRHSFLTRISDILQPLLAGWTDGRTLELEGRPWKGKWVLNRMTGCSNIILEWMDIIRRIHTSHHLNSCSVAARRRRRGKERTVTLRRGGAIGNWSTRCITQLQLQGMNRWGEEKRLFWSLLLPNTPSSDGWMDWTNYHKNGASRFNEWMDNLKRLYAAYDRPQECIYIPLQYTLCSPLDRLNWWPI